MTAIALAGPVYRIPTMGSFINSFALVEDDGSVTLVDCGVERAPRRIVAGLAALGKHPSDVQRIVLTHAHADHAGGAAAMLSQAAAEGVDVHTDEAEFARAGQAPAGDGESMMFKVMQRVNSGKFTPVPVAREFHDGDVLDVAGGLQVFHTPGHTPGHVSLLHVDTGVFITGDVIFNMLRMSWPFRNFCTSFPLNQQSAGVLCDAEYSVAAFTHGPEIREGARERVRNFVARNS